MTVERDLSRLRSIVGAEEFAYDQAVSYCRLDDESIGIIAARAGLSEVGKALVTHIRNSQAEYSPRCVERGVEDTLVSPRRHLDIGYNLALRFLGSPLFNPRIIEIWSGVSIPNVRIEHVMVSHPVHALGVEPDAITFFEYRRLDELLKIPALYLPIAGRWDAPKLRDAAGQYGIGYRLVTDDDIGQVALANLSMLQVALSDASKGSSGLHRCEDEGRASSTLPRSELRVYIRRLHRLCYSARCGLVSDL